MSAITQEPFTVHHNVPYVTAVGAPQEKFGEMRVRWIVWWTPVAFDLFPVKQHDIRQETGSKHPERNIFPESDGSALARCHIKHVERLKVDCACPRPIAE